MLGSCSACCDGTLGIVMGPGCAADIEHPWTLGRVDDGTASVEHATQHVSASSLTSPTGRGGSEALAVPCLVVMAVLPHS